MLLYKSNVVDEMQHDSSLKITN